MIIIVVLVTAAPLIYFLSSIHAYPVENLIVNNPPLRLKDDWYSDPSLKHLPRIIQLAGKIYP